MLASFGLPEHALAETHLSAGVFQQARGPLRIARSAVDEGSLAAAISGAAQLAHVTPDAVKSSANVALEGVPASVRLPIGRLLWAINTATAISESVVLDGAALDRAQATTERFLSASSGDGSLEQLAPETVAVMTDKAESELRNGLDRHALYGAALLVASEIDAAIPQLRAAADSVPAAHGANADCSVVNQPPVLCIGAGANTYTGEYALLVDLGGSSTYTGTAGGANPDLGGPRVSVVLDLGGNDTYAFQGTTGETIAVQGSASNGGIGMLVDVNGDDTFVADGGAPAINAQGYALSGVGLFANLWGNDSYQITDSEFTTDSLGGIIAPRAYGQGYGLVGGLGIALDRDGNDSYLLEATVPEPKIAPDPLHPGRTGLLLGPAKAQGLGLGGLGVGIFSDDAGTDTITMSGTTAPVSPDDQRPILSGCQAVPEDPANFEWGCGDGFVTVFNAGMGTGIVGGVGIALGGPGATTWRAESEVAAPETYVSAMEVMGYGVAGYGGLEDLGGNDTYSAFARTRRTATAFAEDGCACGEARASALSVNRWVDPGKAAAEGMGLGWFFGVGVLRDLGGNDRYDAVAIATAEATARNQRSSSSEEPEAMAEATSGVARVWAQAHVSLDGTALLEDLGGNDVYKTVSLTSATATADAQHGSEVGRALADPSISLSQASYNGLAPGGGGDFGYALLSDEGGADRYETVASTEATASPNTESMRADPVASAQGAAIYAGRKNGAWFADIDGGMTDVIVSTPMQPTCQGVRGKDVWLDCGDGEVGGVNA
jgi:hypothetical protein